MRTALFLAYAFPPAGGVAVTRPVQFAKHLPAHGWRASVLTSSPADHALRDDGRLADVPPDTTVRRVRGFDVNGLRPAASRFGLGSLVTLANLASRAPDAAWLWARRAMGPALELIERERPAVIWSTCGPLSAHRLAERLARRTGLPWVAEFRDPWLAHPYRRHAGLSRAINARMERRVLDHADRVVTVTRGFADVLQSNRTRRDPPIDVIAQGFDPDAVTAAPWVRGDVCRVLVAGSLGPRHPTDWIAPCLERLRAEGDDVRLVFAGRGTQERVPEHPLLERLGFLPQGELPRLRAAAHAFLLLHPMDPRFDAWEGTKVFEYLAAGRPIVTVARETSAVARLVGRLDAGPVVPPEPAAVARALGRVRAVWRAGESLPTPSRNDVDAYSYARHAGRLAALFDEVAA